MIVECSSTLVYLPLYYKVALQKHSSEQYKQTNTIYPNKVPINFITNSPIL